MSNRSLYKASVECHSDTLFSKPLRYRYLQWPPYSAYWHAWPPYMAIVRLLQRAILDYLIVGIRRLLGVDRSASHFGLSRGKLMIAVSRGKGRGLGKPLLLGKYVRDYSKAIVEKVGQYRCE